ncbi:MAG: hypothetical protein M1326_08455 [Cyanobacteria bacterium]|nr:hypothetical protein [Cyanobacteriota bacterium]
MKTNKRKRDEEQIDPKLIKDLNYLVKIGYIKEYNVDGEIIYGIAPLGEEYAKKNLKIDNNKLKSIEDLP